MAIEFLDQIKPLGADFEGALRLVRGKDIDITDAASALTALADADIFLVDDAADGTQTSTKKITAANMKLFMGDNKSTRYVQSGVPNGASATPPVKAGDFWIDTDDNQLYIALADDSDAVTSGEWTAVAISDTNQLTTFTIRDDDNDDSTISQGKFIKFTKSVGANGVNITGSGTTGDPFVVAITSPAIPAVGDGGLTTNDFTDADHTKLNGIEALADVTDTDNVTSAGALMDSELTDLDGVKGVTISTLQPKPSEGQFVDGDKTKLDGIAAGAQVNTDVDVSVANLETRLGEIDSNVTIGNAVTVNTTISGDLEVGAEMMVKGAGADSKLVINNTGLESIDTILEFQKGNVAKFVVGFDDGTDTFKMNSGGNFVGTADFEMDTSGNLTIAGDVNGASATELGHLSGVTSSVATAITTANDAMPKSGGTFTGIIILAADPIADLGAATKQYVDSTYPGRILGYTYNHPTDSMASHLLAQTNLTVEDTTNHRVVFNTPLSQKVEIEVSAFFDRLSTSDVGIYMGLSTSSSYSSMGAEFDYDFNQGVGNSDDEADDTYITAKWVLQASQLAAVGASNTIYVGLASTDASAVRLRYGYFESTSRTYPPMIIKATALPASINTQ